jgi:GcrA cell cycle regulator
LGITRNMVIGKVLRAGLDLPRAKTRLVRGESPATTAIVASKGGSCLWPIGHPSEPGFHFCGAPAFVGKPYCDEHSAGAYVKPERRSGERPTTK